jgi:hypothetical protein
MARTCVELTPNKHVQINPNEFGDRAPKSIGCCQVIFSGREKNLRIENIY